MKAYLKAISYYLPEKVITNEDLIKEFPEWTAEKIAGKVGVKNRHEAAENETASDMARNSAEILFKENSIDRSIIDFVLLCTQSPDYFLPTSACLIQSNLGLRTDIGALDFNLGCSGYVYGLSLAKGLIVAGISKNVLLLTSETYSKHIHQKDKKNRTIFGDAATATLVSDDGFAEVGEFSLGTDGRGGKNLIVSTGGMKHKEPMNDLRFDEEANPISSDHLFMDGGAIFNFTSEAVPLLIDNTLKKNNLTKDDINLFVFHQANKYMMNYLRKLIEILPERFYYCLESFGNTVSSTIPIALSEAMKEGRLVGNIIIAGFGVGYSWGATVLKYTV